MRINPNFNKMHQFLTKNWVKLKMIRIFWRREVDHFHAFDENPLHFELVFGIIITTHNLQFNQRKWPILQTLPFNCCPIKRLCSWQKNDTRWSNFERFSKNCMTPASGTYAASGKAIIWARDVRFREHLLNN